RKRRVPPAMARGLLAVDPDGRDVVDGSEIDQDALVLPRRRNVERAPVPDHVMKGAVADAAQLRLKRIGHRDLLAERLVAPEPAIGESPVLVVELELPPTVQRAPLGAYEIRAGVLGAGDPWLGQRQRPGRDQRARQPSSRETLAHGA